MALSTLRHTDAPFWPAGPPGYWSWREEYQGVINQSADTPVDVLVLWSRGVPAQFREMSVFGHPKIRPNGMEPRACQVSDEYPGMRWV